MLGNHTDIELGETAMLVVSGARAGPTPPSVLGATVIEGTYGTLTIAANDTYSYEADGAATASPQGTAQGSDMFTYTAADPRAPPRAAR